MKKAEKEIKKIIHSFINSSQYRVFVFGSRATGKAKRYSDYDIGIIGKKPLPSKIKVLIEEALEESDLPFKVDIVDFSQLSSGFKEVALGKTRNL